MRVQWFLYVRTCFQQVAGWLNACAKLFILSCLQVGRYTLQHMGRAGRERARARERERERERERDLLKLMQGKEAPADRQIAP